MVLRPSDFVLFESPALSVRVENMTDVLSGSLTARLLFHSYVAFLILRSESIGVVSGSGLAGLKASGF